MKNNLKQTFRSICQDYINNYPMWLEKNRNMTLAVHLLELSRFDFHKKNILELLSHNDFSKTSSIPILGLVHSLWLEIFCCNDGPKATKSNELEIYFPFWIFYKEIEDLAGV